jgi:hypothetical protein
LLGGRGTNAGDSTRPAASFGLLEGCPRDLAARGREFICQDLLVIRRYKVIDILSPGDVPTLASSAVSRPCRQPRRRMEISRRPRAA